MIPENKRKGIITLDRNKRFTLDAGDAPEIMDVKANISEILTPVVKVLEQTRKGLDEAFEHLSLDHPDWINKARFCKKRRIRKKYWKRIWKYVRDGEFIKLEKK